MPQTFYLDRVPAALAVLFVLGACTGEFSRPNAWVEGTTPDLYFVADLPPQTVAANVSFATAPLDRSRLPGDFSIHIASFRVIGDNYYSDTLDYLDLRDPVDEDEDGGTWTWSGGIVFPPFFGQPSIEPTRLGVHIRGLPYAAMRSKPLVHRYCTIDLLGAGVLDCEPWFDAFFHSKVICRGRVGQLIDCHGVGYELVPILWIGGIMGAVPGAELMELLEFVIVGGVTFVQHLDGWRYKDDAGDEQGPFAEPEDAAADAARRLAWPEAVPGIVTHAFPEGPQRRLVSALCRETAARAVEDCE
jgi:hypothetical protein